MQAGDTPPHVVEDNTECQRAQTATHVVSYDCCTEPRCYEFIAVHGWNASVTKVKFDQSKVSS